MNRREFLACSAAAGVTAVPTPRAPRLRAAAAPPAPWYATMRRCGQLNFNERDPLTLDVGAWAEYWASLRVNALLVNGGGIMAFYPTAVPYHHRSAFRSEEHTSELQSLTNLVCRLLLEKKK